jgi:hypothetical protein
LFTLAVAARVGNNQHYSFGDELEKEPEMVELGAWAYSNPFYHGLNFGPIFGFLSQHR